MNKLRRKGQPRDGLAERRALEFEVLVHQVKKNKERLIKRLQGRLTTVGECFVYNGGRDRAGGYPKISFRHNGRHVLIAAVRAFLILKTCAPIPLGFEAGHDCPRHDKGCVRHIALQHWSTNASGAPF